MRAMLSLIASVAFACLGAQKSLGAASINSLNAAEDKTYQINFGPFVGGGTASDGSSVRHISGYSVAVERNFRPAPTSLPRLLLAPRLELTNSFVNTKATQENATDESTYMATYDNRIFAAGFSLEHAAGNHGTFAQGAYLTAMAGKGYTKLSIDETSDSRYRQLLWGGLSGNYFGGEVGAWIPFPGQDHFGINFAVLGSIYTAKLPENAPTQEGEQIDNGQVIALTGTADRQDLTLGDHVSLKTFAAKIGVSLGF